MAITAEQMEDLRRGLNICVEPGIGHVRYATMMERIRDAEYTENYAAAMAEADDEDEEF
jgi:hypothetical protein